MDSEGGREAATGRDEFTKGIADSDVRLIVRSRRGRGGGGGYTAGRGW